MEGESARDRAWRRRVAGGPESRRAGGRAEFRAGRTTRPRAHAVQRARGDRTLSGVAASCGRRRRRLLSFDRSCVAAAQAGDQSVAQRNCARMRSGATDSFAATDEHSQHQTGGDDDGKEKRSKEEPSRSARGRRARSCCQGTAEKRGAAPPRGELSGKDYAREMKKLHVELVKLQEWVKLKGLKVCIVFEGRDGAGKGGTIKAITERVSPRVFRVVALTAPTEREKSQMYVQRYLPHLPAAGEVVIFDRSWYNRAGVERVMGFCTEEEAEGFLKIAPVFERLMVAFRHHPAQVLAGGEPRGADAPTRGAHRRRPQDLEALADGPQVLQSLVRLFEGARRDVRRDRYLMGAVVRRAVRRQAAGPAQHHQPPAGKHRVQGCAAGEGQAAEAPEAPATIANRTIRTSSSRKRTELSRGRCTRRRPYGHGCRSLVFLGRGRMMMGRSLWRS